MNKTIEIEGKNIDDAIEADRIFTKLMGDDTESRKIFINENAEFVKNLDV
mgnify:CR=1 FL=1